MYNKPEPKSNFDDVGDFHTKFGLESVTKDGPRPREIPKKLMGFRLEFIYEELKELIEAVGWNIIDGVIYPPVDWGPGEIDHAKTFDALLDIAYVVHGLAHLLGYPWQVGWDAVQRANMTKVRAERADQSERGGTWDVVKPEGFKPPDIEAILYAHGWEISRFSMPAEPRKYGHDREGYECVPEICGGTRLDPCTYTPEDIARFEALEDQENSK